LNTMLLAWLLASPVPPAGGSGWQPFLQSAVVVEVEDVVEPVEGSEQVPVEAKAEAPEPLPVGTKPEDKLEARPKAATPALGPAQIAGTR